MSCLLLAGDILEARGGMEKLVCPFLQWIFGFFYMIDDFEKERG